MGLKKASDKRTEIVNQLKEDIEYRIEHARGLNESSAIVSIPVSLGDTEENIILSWLTLFGYEYRWLSNGRLEIEFDGTGK